MLTLTQIPDPTQRELFAEANKRIPKLMRKHKVTGLSIAVIDHQNTIWSQGFGYADAKNKVLADEQTIFRACSISKLFTATAIMQLVANHCIDLDSPVKKYLPELKVKNHIKNADFTVRQLLTHHSGLPSDLLRGLGQRNEPKDTNFIKLLNREFHAFTPGLLHSYSNLGYYLLGCIIERITDKSFSEVMVTRLLQPLGMSHSYFASRSKNNAQDTKGYSKHNERPLAHLSNFAAGGLYTSIADLAHLVQMVFAEGQFAGQTILPSETLKKMFVVQNSDVALDFGFRMGLGWVLNPFRELPAHMGSVASHNGAFIHFHSQLIMLLEAKLAVIVLANSESAVSLVHRLATDMIKKAYQYKIGRSINFSAKKQHPPKNMPIRLQGHYAGIHGLSSVYKRGHHYYTKAFGKTFLLEKDQLGRWQLTWCLFGLIPIKKKSLRNLRIISHRINGYELLLLQESSHTTIMGIKVKQQQIDPNWLARLGNYRVINGQGEIFKPLHAKLKVENGFLQFSYKFGRHPKDKLVYLLRTISSKHAKITGLGRGLGLTISAMEHKDKQYIRYSGFLLAKDD